MYNIATHAVAPEPEGSTLPSTYEHTMSIVHCNDMQCHTQYTAACDTMPAVAWRDDSVAGLLMYQLY